MEVSSDNNVEREDEEREQISSYSFDSIFAKRFVNLYKDISSRSSLIVTLLLIGIIGLQTYVMSKTGTVIGGFYGAITDKNENLFMQVLVKAAAVIIASAILDSTVSFLVELVAWQWRGTLCARVQAVYFDHQLYYKLLTFATRVDNPDQRITTDIDNFTASLAAITQHLISFPAVILYYGVKTYTTIAWFAPIIITSYFIFGYIITKIVMSRVVGIIFHQEQLEGDFRISHVRVRSFAEAIALLRGGKRELDEAKSRLNSLLKNKLRIVKWHWSINTSSNFFSYGGSILNYVIVALGVFYNSSNSSAGSIAEASFNCIMLISGFSQLINVATELANLAGYTARIAHLTEVSDELTKKFCNSANNGSNTGEFTNSHEMTSLIPKVVINNNENDNNNFNNDNNNNNKKKKIVSQLDGDIEEASGLTQETCFGGRYEYSNDVIRFENVDCFAPNNKLLVKNVNFELQKGNNLLITGPSGIGKTSILRVMTGLWPSFTGTIYRPTSICYELIHVPQTPYLTRGPLAAQIVYPISQEIQPISNDEMRELLKLVKLEYLLDDGRDNVDSSSTDWGDILSPGEKQRIGLARIFYHKPVFVLLDEATSSLSEEMEKEIYEKLKSMGITYISVGHRSSLLNFHNFILNIQSYNNYSVSPL